jgi:hypothetical protein
MNYALHEALRLALLEGVEQRWQRHEQNHLALKAASRNGTALASQEGHQLWQLNAVRAEGVDEAVVRKQLLTDFDIEIGAGLAAPRTDLAGRSDGRNQHPRQRANFLRAGQIFHQADRTDPRPKWLLYQASRKITRASASAVERGASERRVATASSLRTLTLGRFTLRLRFKTRLTF